VLLLEPENGKRLLSTFLLLMLSAAVWQEAGEGLMRTFYDLARSWRAAGWFFFFETNILPLLDWGKLLNCTL